MFAVRLFLRRYGLQLAILAALAGAAWYIDKRGHDRAEARFRNEQLEAERREAELLRKIETTIAHRIGVLEARTAERLTAIGRIERTVVQPVLTREIRNDPHYTDPAHGVSAGVLDALNEARRASGDPGAAGERGRAVPARAANR